jgi:hypothetical protein
MQILLKDIVTKKILDEYSGRTAHDFWVGCEDTIEGFIEQIELGSNGGDGSNVEIIFECYSKTYSMELTQYHQAGFTSLTEYGGLFEEIKFEVQEVKKVQILTDVWMPI